MWYDAFMNLEIIPKTLKMALTKEMEEFLNSCIWKRTGAINDSLQETGSNMWRINYSGEHIKIL